MHMVLSVLDSFSSMECIFYNKDLFLCFLKPKGLPKTSFDSEFHLRIREKKRRRERERGMKTVKQTCISKISISYK